VLVLKFGGTSVGVAEHFLSAVGMVARAVPDDPVVVVSALAGVTNFLVEWCREPTRREAIEAEVVDRHRRLAAEVRLPIGLLDGALEVLIRDLRAIGRAEAPRRIEGEARDRVLAHGERLAAELLAAGLRAAGVEATAIFAGDVGLVTDDRFGAAHPLPEVPARLREGLGQRPRVPVVTGFTGATLDGRVTTLGRGGSDFSAALIGAALGADEIQIWTDTSGMLSADPRVVPEARVVPMLSFAEASELAYFGARVLHPKTLLPAIERQISVRVLNTARPEDAGSLIVSDATRDDSTWHVKSIAAKKGITAVTIVSTRMLLAHGFLARVFEVFARHHVVVDLVTTSEVSISVTVDDTARLDGAITELEGIGRVEVRRDLAVIAVVGDGAPRHTGLAGHLFTLVGGVGVPVEMISQGASRVNLSFVVAEKDADKIVRLLHRGLGLDVETGAVAGS